MDRSCRCRNENGPNRVVISPVADESTGQRQLATMRARTRTACPEDIQHAGAHHDSEKIGAVPAPISMGEIA